MNDVKVIILTDLLDTRARKEKELQFYAEQLKELQQKMYYIQKEITLTNDIISMIRNEKVLDIREHLNKQREND
jgi:predicted restriction endonuclease